MRLNRIVLAGLGVVLIAVGVGFGGVYSLSEAHIRRVYDTPARPIAVVRTPDAIARGERLAKLLGCTRSCHAPDLTGDYIADDPGFPVIHASNLSLRLRDYSDAEIARAVREGVDRDGLPLWAMPSNGFEMVTDRDMGDLIAYLRSAPPKGQPKPRPRFSWHARWIIATGDYKDIPGLVAEARARPAVDLGAPFARGRYLARTACTECHQSDLTGSREPGFKTPDLMIAATYDLPTFKRLMRTGVAADGKTRGLMSEVARNRFANFTDDEVAALHAYLTARAERAP